METRVAEHTTGRTGTQPAFVSSDDELVRKRLDTLLELNAEIAREKSLYRSGIEQTEADMMRKPLDSPKAFSYFGLMLGTLPPATLFSRWLIETNAISRGEFWVIGVMAVVVLLSGMVGYFSGKVVGKGVRHLEKGSWSAMMLTLPFMGLLWGMVSGAAGGIIIFVIGAFFGAALGGLVGAAALPAFGLLHRLMKRGEMIEQKHFVPLALGVTLTICSFILGVGA